MLLSLLDFEAAAKKRLPKSIHGYMAGGSEDEATLCANRNAFSQWAFIPRVLVDVGNVALATPLLGMSFEAPFGICPMGASVLCCYEGDLVLARAAAKAKVPFILSGTSTVPMEKIVEAAPETWFQAYLPPTRPATQQLLDRVAASGFKTLVVTVDFPVPSNRENNLRNGFSLPLRPSLKLVWDGVTHPRWLTSTFARTLMNSGVPRLENKEATRGRSILAAPSAPKGGRGHTQVLDDLAWIRSHWTGKLVVKGILAPEDASRVATIGCDAIIVSNHGGRQLDHSVASLSALPAIRAAVPNTTVMLDGGVRRGTDVLKALALGADFVFVGRPMLCAAAVNGEAGVSLAIDLLKQEIERDMALVGRCSIADITENLLSRT